MDQYIGKMLDNRYEILERIGVGGMAVVYKARCHRLNRLVAIKILKPELASDPDFRRRFQAESQAVAMLSHVNIVGVYDVCQSDGLNYIVMELVDGMTLKQYMQKRGTPLKWQEALHFTSQVLRALDHAHSRGIIHRDIKPHNILVLRDGSIKVADFGIARLTSTQATLTQEAIGSVHYISPEQAKGSHIDGRSDLYSVGVMLYEMLTGRLPFEGETPVLIAIQHINSIPIQPRELNPDIPVGLEAIIMKAMAPNPNQRYASAQDMLDAVTEFQKNPDAVPSDTIRLDDVEEPTRVIPINSNSESNSENELDQDVGDDTGEVYDDYDDEYDDDYEDEEKTGRIKLFGGRVKVPPIAIAVAAILIFVVGLVAFLFSFIRGAIFAPAKQYTVPNLLGHTVEELEKDPSILGDFKIEIGETVYNDEYEKDQICEQTPEADTKVKDGKSTITVTISGGTEELKMIDVTGWDVDRALKILEDDMKLKVTKEYEYSQTIEEGYIISYTPKKDTELEEGDEVTLVVSKGKEEEQQQQQTQKVTVGNYVDMSVEQAKGQLELQGLKANVKEYHSDTYAQGKVMWQSISQGTQVDPGTTIDLQVSLGPEATQPPATNPPVVSTDAPVKKTITVDLSDYTGTISLKVTLGSSTVFDGSWNASEQGNFSREVTQSPGTTKRVTIYIDGDRVESYDLEF